MFVIAFFFFFVCLEFQIIRFVITPIFFIEISFVLLPPPRSTIMLKAHTMQTARLYADSRIISLTASKGWQCIFWELLHFRLAVVEANNLLRAGGSA